MPLAGSLPSSFILRCTSSFLFSLSKKPLLFSPLHARHARCPLVPSIVPRSSLRQNIKHLPSKPLTRPMTTASTQNPNPTSSRSTKKARRDAPEYVLRHQLGMCSRNQDLPEALRLYDAARKECVPLSIDHYNSLLYLCSLSLSPSSSNSSPHSSRGFEIYNQMLLDKIAPNEATFTSLARLAANDRNPALAFDFIKQMQGNSIPPKLRSYGPALFGFCDNGDLEKAREVESHMDANGIVPEEPELRALLKVSAESRSGEEVYRVLHRMRSLVRRVSNETAEVVEDWFGTEAAEEVGKEEWDEREVKDGVVKGGGGWHGIGWLGKGKWSVGRTEMDGSGVCRRCGEKLICIDIDPVETKEFARKLANLACEREVKADFMGFQV